MAKKTRNTVGTSRAYPNKRSKKNKHSDRQEFSVWTRGMRGRNEKRLLCNECEQKKKRL